MASGFDHKSKTYFITTCCTCPFNDGVNTGCVPYPCADGPCASCEEQKLGRPNDICPTVEDEEDEDGNRREDYVSPCPKPSYCKLLSVTILMDDSDGKEQG